MEPITCKHLGKFAVIVLLAGVMANSCKKGATLGSTGHPFDGPHPTFDTLVPPSAKYYFYGKFDGHFLAWEDSLRSKWDTTNAYYNFCDQSLMGPCGCDPENSFYELHTHFIRPAFADRRLDIFFYDCVDLDDIEDPYHVSAVKEIANPFADIQSCRNGVQVVYTDENRVVWSTDPGSGQLDDTYFRVTDFYQRDLSIPTTDTFALYVVEGTFSGRLFNSEKEEMVVTEARFRARLVKDE